MSMFWGVGPARTVQCHEVSGFLLDDDMIFLTSTAFELQSGYTRRDINAARPDPDCR